MRTQKTLKKRFSKKRKTVRRRKHGGVRPEPPSVNALNTSTPANSDNIWYKIA